MWNSLDLFVLDRIFKYLDGYTLLFIIPEVCLSWKHASHQIILVGTLNLNSSQNACKFASNKLVLTDENLHKILLNFNIAQITGISFLDQYNIQDRSILNLSNYCHSLTKIDLRGCCSLNDVSIKYLSSVQTLEDLAISLAEITGNSLHFLARSSGLKVLVLEKLFRLKEEFLESFLKKYQRLRKLCVRQCKLISHDFFLFLLTEIEAPDLEELLLDGLTENKDSHHNYFGTRDFGGEPPEVVRFPVLRKLELFNLIWLQELLLIDFIRNLDDKSLKSFQIVRCNPMLVHSIDRLLHLPNIQGFCVESNQAIEDREVLPLMFGSKAGVFRNCCNVSDQMKRQMARTNPIVVFEDTALVEL